MKPSQISNIQLNKNLRASSLQQKFLNKYHYWEIQDKEGNFIDKNRAPNAYLALLVAKDKIGDRVSVKIVEKLDV